MSREGSGAGERRGGHSLACGSPLPSSSAPGRDGELRLTSFGFSGSGNL